MPHYITRTCPVCGEVYQADVDRLKYGRQTTCSRECSYKLRAEKLTTLITTSCEFCGKEFQRQPSQFKKHHFCSQICFDAWRVKEHHNIKGKNPRAVLWIKNRKCPICGTVFYSRKDRAKYCSRKCFEIAHKDYMQGENNPAYIDGRSVEKNYNAGSEWHHIRRQVYKRDNYTCQICGIKCVGRKYMTKQNSHRLIQCHHIDPYKKSQNNDLDNLVTLCICCHQDVHNGRATI